MQRTSSGYPGIAAETRHLPQIRAASQPHRRGQLQYELRQHLRRNLRVGAGVKLTPDLRELLDVRRRDLVFSSAAQGRRYFEHDRDHKIEEDDCQEEDTLESSSSLGRAS